MFYSPKLRLLYILYNFIKIFIQRILDSISTNYIINKNKFVYEINLSELFSDRVVEAIFMLSLNKAYLCKRILLYK